MDQTLTIKARRISPTQVELEEALPDDVTEIQVVARRTTSDSSKTLDAFLDMISKLPPGTRSKEDIDRQIREERDSWETGR
jgi:hypothetical protein